MLQQTPRPHTTTTTTIAVNPQIQFLIDAVKKEMVPGKILLFTWQRFRVTESLPAAVMLARPE